MLLAHCNSKKKVALANLFHEDLLSNIPINEKIGLAWEPRGEEWKSKVGRELMKEFVEKCEGAHCTDMSKDKPAAVGNFIYTRLFGKGKHNIYQFSSDEITEIFKKIIGLGERAERVYVIAHTKKMYIDAARMKKYVESGVIPPATRSVGIESVREVLSEDAKFPITRDELIKIQGWKVITWVDMKDVKLLSLIHI